VFDDVAVVHVSLGCGHSVGKAGTQATDPTPAPPQTHAGRAGSTTHILPADYARVSVTERGGAAVCRSSTSGHCRLRPMQPSRWMRCIICRSWYRMPACRRCRGADRDEMGSAASQGNGDGTLPAPRGPSALLSRLSLRRLTYPSPAAHGHFGQDDPGLTG